jgi:hypothetical protein
MTQSPVSTHISIGIKIKNKNKIYFNNQPIKKNKSNYTLKRCLLNVFNILKACSQQKNPKIKWSTFSHLQALLLGFDTTTTEAKLTSWTSKWHHHDVKHGV